MLRTTPKVNGAFFAHVSALFDRSVGLYWQSQALLTQARQQLELTPAVRVAAKAVLNASEASKNSLR